LKLRPIVFIGKSRKVDFRNLKQRKKGKLEVLEIHVKKEEISPW
jgi:hypothetical protein